MSTALPTGNVLAQIKGSNPAKFVVCTPILRHQISLSPLYGTTSGVPCVCQLSGATYVLYLGHSGSNLPLLCFYDVDVLLSDFQSFCIRSNELLKGQENFLTCKDFVAHRYGH